eukprot:g10244.t1
MTETGNRSAGSTDRPRKRKSEGEGDEQFSQSTTLVRLAKEAGIALFHTPGADPDGFADIPIEGHRETWRIGAKAFRYWLQRLFWESEKRAANAQALQDAIGVLRGIAMFDGPEMPVAVRLAEDKNAIWLDLANAEWQAVHIDADGWRVVDRPTVQFCRPRGMLALPTPERGGDIAQLRRFLNVGSDEDWLLMLAWLAAAMRPQGPYPVLAIHGEQGSAKSTTCRILRSIIDPNQAPLRSDPRDARDLIIAATNGSMVALENLSSIPVWLSDALCRLATGGGFSTRELYSDGEEKLFNATRPVLLNGITELATRSDLLDRTIAVRLPTIPDEKRRTESQLWPEFNQALPKILGALLDGISAALREVDSVELQQKPRMADFAVWATAAETAWGCKPGEFLAAYAGNRETLNESAVESSIIAGPLLQLLDGRNEWEGTATELLGELEEQAGEKLSKRREWPKRPNNLSGELTRIAPNLRRMNINVDAGKRGGRRFIRISRTTAQNSVHSAPRVPHSGNGDSTASRERPVAWKLVRVFKQKYRDRKGILRESSKWYVEFVDHNETTRRLPGFTDKKATAELGRKLEALAAVRMNGDTVPADLAKWLQSTSNAIRDRIGKWGLLDARTVANRKPLTKHLDDFHASLLHKGNTADHAKLVKARAKKLCDGCGFKHYADITASKVQKHLAELRDNGDGISAQTSNFYLQAVKQFCRWMVKDNRATESAVDHLTGVNVKTDRRHDRRNLTAVELTKLLKKTASGPTRHKMTGRARAMLYRVAMETGLRRKELQSLRAMDVETESVPPAIVVHPTNTKNRRPAVQAIRPELATELREWLADTQTAPDAPLWPYVTQHTSKMLQKDLKAADIDYVDDAGLYADFHSLRHSFVSMLAQGNVHPKLAQKLARHSDINLTMSRYSHTLLADEAQALDSLPAFPSVFDEDTAETECQTLQATGTDDNGESVLPSGRPESVASDRNSVHPDAQSADRKAGKTADVQRKENPRNDQKKPAIAGASAGGEGGIRTPGGCYTTPVFKTGAFGHSATSPVGELLGES